MPLRLPPNALRAAFLDRATARFAAQVPHFGLLRDRALARGGVFHNDHGAVRSADPRATRLLERAANLMGLHRDRQYDFPAKRLTSFDCQAASEDARTFKLFVSQVQVSAFPAAVAAAIQADAQEQFEAAQGFESLVRLLHVGQQQGGLTDTQAQDFLEVLLGQLMTRPGPSLKHSTLTCVAAVSGEVASALALGLDFNHLTLDVRAAGYPDLEALVADFRPTGVPLLPAIQGAPGSMLRQTATLAQPQPTPVREDDGTLGEVLTEQQFVEFIERNQARNAAGDLLWQQDGQPLIYRHFLAANAEKIFEAAATRLA